MVELHLNLYRVHFDNVDAGIKREEYRAITPYWMKRFRNGYIVVNGKSYHPTDVVLVFSNGYKKDRPQIRVQCTGLRVGYGNSHWGAPEEPVYILGIGEKMKYNRCQKCKTNRGTAWQSSCPYQREINNDFNAECNCCSDCINKCLRAI